MSDFPYWYYEIDGALPVKCANCDRRLLPGLLRDGLCEWCAERLEDDARELRAEAGRTP